MEYSYRVGRAVEVDLETANRHGEPTRTIRGRVALSDNGSIFGLAHPYDPASLTHMAYGMDYFVPADVLAHAETRGGWMWFDAGTSCPEIKISAAELRRAFVELGMVYEAASGTGRDEG